jgi:MGT family glycosyltransferase
MASLTEQILDVDRLLVLTSRAFELPQVRPPAHVRYVGPQLPPPPEPLESARTWREPPGPDGHPLLLVSLSTTDQGQLNLLQRLLQAIAPLPVRALVTLGPAIAPHRLCPPPNVMLETFVPHAAVLPRASVVVTHAGHGTVMAVLRAGVPVVCLPMGRDQPAVAQRVTHHGLGLNIDPNSSVGQLSAAIRQVLDQPRYRQATQRMAEAIATESPNRVVEEIEAAAMTTTTSQLVPTLSSPVT